MTTAIGATRAFGPVLLLVLGSAVVSGCRTCRYDKDDLPAVLCEGAPPSSPGCSGLPGEPPGTSTKTYPVGCEVYSTTTTIGNAECGYSAFVCSPDPFGTGKTYAWTLPR